MFKAFNGSNLNLCIVINYIEIVEIVHKKAKTWFKTMTVKSNMVKHHVGATKNTGKTESWPIVIKC